MLLYLSSDVLLTNAVVAKTHLLFLERIPSTEDPLVYNCLTAANPLRINRHRNSIRLQVRMFSNTDNKLRYNYNGDKY